MSEDNQSRIIGYIDYIKKHPKMVGYFAFDANRKFVVDGNKIKMLPTEYSNFYTKDEFYISIDPDAKKVIYYAFDLDTNKECIDENLGHFEWDKVSDQIYSFLTLHLKELTTTTTPHSDVKDKVDHSSTTHTSTTSTKPNSSYGVGYSYNDNGFGSKSYKERDAFFTKIGELLKECKTSTAIDHAHTTLVKMREEKRFDDLDLLLKFITFDKLNVPVMLTILDITKGIEPQLKERKDFYGKVKTHLMKIKPTKADYILRNVGA